MGSFRPQLNMKGFLVIITIFIVFVLFSIVAILATLGLIVLEYGKDTPNYLYTVITGRDPKIPSDFTGTWRTWMVLGGVAEEFEVREGVRHGKYVSYYEFGQKMVEGFYKKGKEDGKWISYHRNGQKNRECFWKDGQENGRIMEWDDKGNLLSVTWKYEGWPLSKEEFEQRTASEDPNK
jgi:hypothetical protein